MSDTPIVVVTGSSGFIGVRVVERLEGLGVRVTKLDTSEGQSQDVRDPSIASLIPKGSSVVHLAALSTSGQCSGNPLLAVDVNIRGSLNLWNAAVEAGARRFVFASTEWVYGNSGDDRPTTEEADVSLRTLTDTYAITKAAAESLLRAAPGEMELAVLRFGIVYGPRRSGWSAAESLLHSVATSDHVSVGSLKTSRRFIHVDDISAAVVSAALGAGTYTLNIAGSRLVTLSEVIEVSQRITGRTVLVSETSPAAASIRNPDPSNASQTLGWRPLIDFDEGMQDVARHLGVGNATSHD